MGSQLNPPLTLTILQNQNEVHTTWYGIPNEWDAALDANNSKIMSLSGPN